jgi:hypothetical protein
VAQKLLAQAGGGGVGSQRSQIRPHTAWNVQNGEKNGRFCTLFAYKSLKTPFFSQKYLKRKTPETFFEEYMDFKIFHY